MIFLHRRRPSLERKKSRVQCASEEKAFPPIPKSQVTRAHSAQGTPKKGSIGDGAGDFLFCSFFP